MRHPSCSTEGLNEGGRPVLSEQTLRQLQVGVGACFESRDSNVMGFPPQVLVALDVCWMCVGGLMWSALFFPFWVCLWQPLCRLFLSVVTWLWWSRVIAHIANARFRVRNFAEPRPTLVGHCSFTCFTFGHTNNSHLQSSSIGVAEFANLQTS